MKKTMLLLGWLSLALLPNLACSNLDSNDNVVENSNFTAQHTGNTAVTNKIDLDPAIIVKASNTIRDEVKSDPKLIERLRNPPIVNGQAQYVNQTILDRFLDVANLNQYSSQITVDFVNKMIAESVEMYKVGADNYIQNSKLLSAGYKDYYQRLINEDVTVDDFKNEAQFMSLSALEQDNLVYADSLITYLNTSRLVKYWEVGVIAGMSIGTMIGGYPIGTLVGGIVGGLIGSCFDK
ncbi:MAG: hypothetical protein MUW56_14445 [Chryseobacterium sp.]|uniref:hypothetical protein n=1 Tax=Chryseobacterium sp. TaxID=1871047 RepID=UPI0025B9269C|nr:hypothetical protein [Chryseobacterium sp.]MCJ7934786.1 hypothetical protein [Chryseobacterium sp.]